MGLHADFAVVFHRQAVTRIGAVTQVAAGLSPCMKSRGLGSLSFGCGFCATPPPLSLVQNADNFVKRAFVEGFGTVGRPFAGARSVAPFR